jgi:hypothetical protein
MRTEVLKKTPLIGNLAWADLVLLGELCLLGEFYEIPEYLFFFRWHENSSRETRKVSWEALALWYDSKNQGKILMPTCTLFSQQLQSVNRVPMTAFEKIACYVQLAQWFSWKWKTMVKEMLIAMLQILNKTFKFKKPQERLAA